MISLSVILFLFAVYVVCLYKFGPQTVRTKYKTVSAGEVDKNYSSTIRLHKNIYASKISDSNKKVIDIKDFEVYVAIGDSMQKNGINDRDFVFVRNLPDDARYNLQNGNILLIKIDRSKDIQKSDVIDYKLRRFIAYIAGGKIDFDAWFGYHQSVNKALTGKKEYLRSKYEKCIEKYRKNNSEPESLFALSSTFNAEIGESDYSFHPVKFLYGIVKYTVKGSKEEC